MFREVEFEAGITAFVFSDPCSVQPNLRDLVNSFELQENTFASFGFTQIEVFAVPPEAAEIARLIVAAVKGILSMGKEDKIPIRIVIHDLGCVAKLGFDFGAKS